MGYSMMMDDVQDHVVEKVLKGYLKGDDLISAVSLWNKQYRHQPMDKLSFFVFEIASSSTLRSLRKQILLDLEKHLKDEDLKSDTLEKLLEESTQSSQIRIEEALNENLNTDEEAPVVVIQTETLDHCLKQLLSVLEHIERDELLEVLDEQFEEHQELPTFIKEELRFIIRSKQMPHYLTYDEDNIRQTLNIMYSMICEYIGPVIADRVLAQAIEHTAQKYPLENMVRFL